jgi:hypothetical protein
LDREIGLSAAKQVAEKAAYFAIPSEARNLSLIDTQERFLGAQGASE